MAPVPTGSARAPCDAERAARGRLDGRTASKSSACLRREPQYVDQPADGLPPRPRHAPFEILDRPLRDARALGELFLREPDLQAVASEQGAKGLPRL